MKAPGKTPRVLFALPAGCLGSLATFGLLLALAWSLPLANSVAGRLACALLAAAMAILVGSWIIVHFLPGQRWPAGALFGVTIGLVGFGYTLGLDARLLVFLPASALLGALGGCLAGRTSPQLHST